MKDNTPKLRYCKKNGGFTFTVAASELLQIRIGDRVDFFKDEKKRWCFRITKDSGHLLKLHTYEYYFRFGSKQLVRDLSDSYGNTNKFYFSKVEKNGDVYYRLKKA